MNRLPDTAYHNFRASKWSEDEFWSSKIVKKRSARHCKGKLTRLKKTISIQRLWRISSSYNNNISKTSVSQSCGYYLTTLRNIIIKQDGSILNRLTIPHPQTLKWYYIEVSIQPGERSYIYRHYNISARSQYSNPLDDLTSTNIASVTDVSIPTQRTVLPQQIMHVRIFGNQGSWNHTWLTAAVTVRLEFMPDTLYVIEREASQQKIRKKEKNAFSFTRLCPLAWQIRIFYYFCFLQPDRAFHIFRASKFVARRFRATWNSLFHGLWG